MEHLATSIPACARNLSQLRGGQRHPGDGLRAIRTHCLLTLPQGGSLKMRSMSLRIRTLLMWLLISAWMA
jgi:hypothetical protein